MLGDDRGKDTSVFDISGQGTFLTVQTDQLLYYYSHNQHVIMCFVSLCHCLAVFDDIINAIAHIAGEFDLI